MLDDLEKLVNKFKDSNLIIFVKDGKVEVVEKGKLVKGVKSVDFTASLDEIPKVIIEKLII